MNIFRKLKTKSISPKTIPVSTPPTPLCELSKKELPEPPFNATVARSYAHWKEEEAVKTIRDKIWSEITDEVKRGGVSTTVSLPIHPTPSMFRYTDIERACLLLSNILFKIVKVMAEDFVKNGYQMTITNDIYSDGYYDRGTAVGRSDVFSRDRIWIEINWEEPESVREPYLKTIDHSGLLIKEIDENNAEHYVRPERVIVKTKGGIGEWR